MEEQRGLIYIPIDDSSHGGGSTFFRNINPYLDYYDLTYNIADPWDLAFLVGAQLSMSELFDYVVPRVVYGDDASVLYRLDGIKHTRMPEGQKRMEKAYEVANHVVFQSECVRKEAYNTWGIRENTHVIYNGVDVRKFRPSTDKRSDFLYCEFSWKTHKKAQEAFGLLKKVLDKFDKDATITIVGKFPDDWAKNCFGLPQKNVRHLTRVDHNEMARIIADHKVLLFPSEDEPCSNLVLEAMACGTVIIHKDSGCMPELCGDTQVQWTGQLDSIDEALSKVGELKGRKRVLDHFTVEQMVSKYLQLVGKLL